MVESVLRRVHAGQYGELMTSAWISTNWVAEQKVLTHFVLGEMRGVRIIW